MTPTDPLDAATARLSDGALVVGALRELKGTVEETRRDGIERGQRTETALARVDARLEALERQAAVSAAADQAVRASSFTGMVSELPAAYKFALFALAFASLTGLNVREVLALTGLQPAGVAVAGP